MRFDAIGSASLPGPAARPGRSRNSTGDSGAQTRSAEGTVPAERGRSRVRTRAVAEDTLRSPASPERERQLSPALATRAPGGSLVSSVAALTAGVVLGGKYRLLAPLARGAMGAIWRAEQLELGCAVAMKLIEEREGASAEARERFLLEARTLAALRSAHIVQVLDYGVDQHRPYLVMELLEGETLLQRLARAGRLSKQHTSQILSQVALALHRVHAAGVVHRDLSANNVFITKEGGAPLAKLLDFGIAKPFADGVSNQRSVLTVRGMILGTPRYMSPEQAEGTRIDFRTDLWAMGVLAFECLLGFAPFQGETFGSLVLSICSRELPVPSQCGRVPAAFDDWFARACAREPSQRFASAAEAGLALRRALRGRG